MRSKLKTTRLNSRGFVFIRQSAKLEAGLPNITGATGVWVFMNKSSQATGAFSTNILAENTMATSNYSANDNNVSITFNANKSNPIYGNSNTVQPPAIQLIPQVKY